MTDWTKEGSDEDDKFWEWMDKDKENFKKIPKVQKPKKKKKIAVAGLIAIALVIVATGMLSNNGEFSSEKYFYIPDYRLNKSPLLCAQEFSDPLFPDANDIMLAKTFDAVKNWQTSIERYTDTNGVWNFEYKTIPKESSFRDFGCDATIIFERFPPAGREIVRGETALSHYGFSDVVIFYVDPSSGDKLDPNVDLVLTHEIGHVLGLGHPIFAEMYDGKPFYRNDNDVLFSHSIMVTPEVYPFLPSGLVYSITDYDVRAVVNLYGGGISNTPIFFGYLNYIVIAILLFGTAFFVNKKLKD